MAVPEEFVPECTGPTAWRTSCFEALCFPFALWTFRDIVAGRSVVVFSDNSGFTRAFASQNLIGGFLQVAVLACTLVQAELGSSASLLLVPTAENLSDHFARAQVAEGIQACEAARLPVARDPAAPSFPLMEKFWRRDLVYGPTPQVRASSPRR